MVTIVRVIEMLLNRKGFSAWTYSCIGEELQTLESKTSRASGETFLFISDH